jgi:trehalose-phosphatase
MRHLLENLDVIRRQMDRSRNFYFFLDYDGTLTPIVSRPDLAFLSLEAKRILNRLQDCPQVFVAIISGRSLEDLYDKIRIPGITYVGNHGLEIRNPAGIHKKVLSANRKKEMWEIQATLKRNLGTLPGILFEDKESTFSIHYRMAVRESHRKVSKEIGQVIKKWGARWMVLRGKMVFEIRPRLEFHKGKAVKDLLKEMPETGLLPFCFGDDRTDEDAFRFLRDRGITVFVGPPESPSEAEYYLQNPGEVLEFLRRMAKTDPIRKWTAEKKQAGRWERMVK